MNEEVAPFDGATGADLDETTRATAVVSRLAVAETAFVEMEQRDGKWSVRQDSST